jgi:hypothetical protein
MRPEYLDAAAFFPEDELKAEESRGRGSEGEGAGEERFGD